MLIIGILNEQEVLDFHHGYILPICHTTGKHRSWSHPLLAVRIDLHFFVYKFRNGWHFVWIEELKEVALGDVWDSLVDFSHLPLAFFTLPQDLFGLRVVL